MSDIFKNVRDRAILKGYLTPNKPIDKKNETQKKGDCVYVTLAQIFSTGGYLKLFDRLIAETIYEFNVSTKRALIDNTISFRVSTSQLRKSGYGLFDLDILKSAEEMSLTLKKSNSSFFAHGHITDIEKCFIVSSGGEVKITMAIINSSIKEDA